MERFNTIDGETLMNKPLTPIRFVVYGLLSQGLHLLAGAPKSGKSWLALWLSVTVAKGEDVWGNKVHQGTTLYLCFEDSRLRIQNRLFEITEDPDLVKRIDAEYPLYGCASRSDFMCKAAAFYLGFLHNQEDTEYMNKTTLSFLEGQVSKLDAKICRQHIFYIGRLRRSRSVNSDAVLTTCETLLHAALECRCQESPESKQAAN